MERILSYRGAPDNATGGIAGMGGPGMPGCGGASGTMAPTLPHSISSPPSGFNGSGWGLPHGNRNNIDIKSKCCEEGISDPTSTATTEPNGHNNLSYTNKQYQQ